MSAIAEPKKPFRKSPVKYQYRLAAGVKAKSSEWTGGQGNALSVLSSVAYLTARDVANQLRIEPHVAQGLLQRLLVRGAVERRIIPGSVHDLSTKGADRTAVEPLVKGFDNRIRPGSIIEFVADGDLYVVVGVGVDGAGKPAFKIRESPGSSALGHATTPRYWKYRGQTPNPIAFNQGRYAECFTAPVVKKPKDNLVAAISEKVDEAVNTKFPFKVGDVINHFGEVYEIIALTDDDTTATIKDIKLGYLYARIPAACLCNDTLVCEPKFYVARPELLPNDALSEVSKVFGLGADKYARDDWAKPNNGGGDHIEAALRHIDAHRSGRLIECGENGSGLPHLWHAAARLLMAIGKEMRNR